MKFSPQCKCSLIVSAIWALQFAGSTFAEGAATPDDSSIAALGQLVEGIAREFIPHTFESLKDWGKTSKRWDGVKVRFEGLQLKTKRQWKEVNDGTWKMYRVNLLHPEERFHLELTEFKKRDDGFVEFELHVRSPLHAFGRLSQWVKGVQLLSISADAQASVRLHVRCQLRPELDITRIPPDVILNAKVTHAKLYLDHFRMIRVSKVGGEVAKQIGQGAHGLIKDRLAKENERLVEKLNKRIEKDRHKLRLSSKDLLESKWGSLVGGLAKAPKK